MPNYNTTQSLPPGTTANDVLAGLQSQFGAVRYNQQQMLRYPYYYNAAYPAAGANVVQFFGTSLGQSSAQITNIEQAGGFGNVSFLLSAVSFDFWVYNPATTGQPQTYTDDTTSIYSDIVHGFTQGGYFEFTVGNLKWIQTLLPFMFAPPANGRLRCEVNQGAFAFSQAGLSPFAVTGSQNILAYADLERRACRKMNLVNPIFIAPQQNFIAQVSYPSGAIPIIATAVVTGGAVLYVRCCFDGYKFTPIG